MSISQVTPGFPGSFPFKCWPDSHPLNLNKFEHDMLSSHVLVIDEYPLSRLVLLSVPDFFITLALGFHDFSHTIRSDRCNYFRLY